MNFKDIINIDNNPIFFSVKVITNSPKNEIYNVMDNGVIKIKIKGAPEKQKANKQLINFISKELGFSKSKINIVSGITNKNKIIKIDF